MLTWWDTRSVPRALLVGGGAAAGTLALALAGCQRSKVDGVTMNAARRSRGSSRANMASDDHDTTVLGL